MMCGSAGMDGVPMRRGARAPMVSAPMLSEPIGQQQALLLTRQAAMNNRIDLYKVLGGGLVDVTAVPAAAVR